jgi:riboflavin synthase
MFTGIVTEVGRIVARTPLADGVELTIQAPGSAPRLSLGASILVNGVCQTVVELGPHSFKVQAVGATLDRTTFGRLQPNVAVNLEPSLRMGDELGGHLVMGHVDGTARVTGITKRGDAVYLSIRLPDELSRFAAARGSLAVDGVSLTIAEVDGNTATFSLIPHTMAHTIAQGYQVGHEVNVEVDLMARYLDRLVSERNAPSRSEGRNVTLEILKEKFS